MSLFFTIFGFIFTVMSGIFISQIYTVFSINKITKFLKSTEKSIYNTINTSIFPILCWAIIELLILNTSKLFLPGVILNIFLNCAVSYIIIYSFYLLYQKESNIVIMISIVVGNVFGYIVNYLCLLISDKINQINPFINIIGLLLIIIGYLLIKKFPPKSNFFKEIIE